MIYIVSEDNFFTLGLIATLKHADIDAIHIGLEELQRIKDYVSAYDILVSCLQSRESSIALKALVQDIDVRVIHFIDTAIEKCVDEVSHVGLLPKNINRHNVVNSIRNAKDNRRIKATVLSEQETTVMNLLTQQKNSHGIAKLLGISSKTVFTHKLSALHKLGLSHLNARSILIYERLFKINNRSQRRHLYT